MENAEMNYMGSVMGTCKGDPASDAGLSSI